MKGKGEREEKKRREKGKEEGEGEETYTLRSQNGHWRGLRTRLDILSNTASQLNRYNLPEVSCSSQISWNPQYLSGRKRRFRYCT